MYSVNAIGPLIKKGLSSRQIRKQYPWFPSNPDIDFFMTIGYKESTAKTYLQTLLKRDEEERLKLEESGFILSDGANLDNLLVDTCALSLTPCLDLIKDANKVTFIYPTLVEMDMLKAKLKAKKPSMYRLIQDATLNILKNPQYLLSQFKGSSNDGYVDNILIQYLTILPIQIRPTLLTKDYNLAVKAKLYELEFILARQFQNQAQNSEKSSTSPNTKKLGYGLYIEYEGEKQFLVYKGTHDVIIHHGKKTLKYHGPRTEVFSGDLVEICVKGHGDIQRNRFKI